MARQSEFPDRNDLDLEALARFGHRAVDWIAEYLGGFDREPILQTAPPSQVVEAFQEPLPEEGLPADAVFEAFQQKVARYATHLQHPGNFAYIPNSASLVGVVADALASALNQNTSLWRGGPSSAAVEQRVIAWLKEMIGYPDEGDGSLTSGGSIANLMGLALARDRAGAGQNLIFYLSAEVHSSIQRGLRFLGFGREAIQVVATDKSYRMDPGSLARAVARDRAKGKNPAAVVASAGTVASGAVDPLEDIGDFCREQNLWLHVDGAYGALAAACPSGAWMRAGLARADSLSLDPHKWLFVPLDASCLLVRDPEHMRRSFNLVPEYLKVSGPEEEEKIHHPMENSIELSRRFRALKIWMTLKVYGARAIREKIESHLRLARKLASRLDGTAGFELLAPIETSIVCFRRVPPGAEKLPPGEREEVIDRLNQEVMERVNRAGGLFMSHCRLGGAFALRACITHLRTTEKDVDRLWEAVGEASAEVESEMNLA